MKSLSSDSSEARCVFVVWTCARVCTLACRKLIERERGVRVWDLVRLKCGRVQLDAEKREMINNTTLYKMYIISLPRAPRTVGAPPRCRHPPHVMAT